MTTPSEGGGTATPAVAAFGWADALAAALGANPQEGDRWAGAVAGVYVRDPALLPAMERFAADASPAVRDVGILGVGMCGTSQAQTFVRLRAMLADRTGPAKRRASAALALAFVGDTLATSLLQAALADRANPDTVRFESALGLGILGDVSATPDLARVLRDARSPDTVRAMAAGALGLLARVPTPGPAGPSAATVLLDALRDHDTLPAVARQMAALALGGLTPGRAAVERLGEMLRGDPDAATRACAALALGRVARGDPECAREAHAVLVAALDSDAPDVVAYMWIGLGMGRHAKARERLEAVLGRGSDPSQRAAAAVGLGLCGDAAAIPALLAAARSGADPESRAYMAEAIGMIGGPAARDALHALGGEGAPEVRGAALHGLGLVGVAADRPEIARALTTGNPMVRQGAILGLASLGGAASRDTLLAHVRAESLPELRSLALRSAALSVAPAPVSAIHRKPPFSPWLRIPEQ